MQTTQHLELLELKLQKFKNVNHSEIITRTTKITNFYMETVHTNQNTLRFLLSSYRILTQTHSR